MTQKRFVEHVVLELKNIGLFREFSVDLRSGQVTEVTGGNGRGKTTLLKALKLDISGGRCKVPDDLVLDCETVGAITVGIDDDFTIRRDIREGETSTDLALYDANGLPMKGKSPAALLEELLGDGTFLSPMDLVRMRPEERAKSIATTLELDPQKAEQALLDITGRKWTIKHRSDIFAVIEEAHASFYEARKQKRSDRESAEAQAKGVISYLPQAWLDAKGEELPPPPAAPAPLGDIYDRKRECEIQNALRARLTQEIDELAVTILQHEAELAVRERVVVQLEQELQDTGAMEDEAALEEQIRRLQAQLAEMRDRNMRRRQFTLKINAARADEMSQCVLLDGVKERQSAKITERAQLGDHEDVSALQARIDAHEADMDAYREALKIYGDYHSRWMNMTALLDKAKALQTEWEQLQWQVDAIERLPITLLNDVTLPIPGMQFYGKDGADLYLPDGDALRKFDALGDADQLRYAARLAMELAPLNILIIDGAEKCDDDRRLMLYRMAAEHEFIVFSTRVTRGPLTIQQIAGPDWEQAAL